MWRSLSIAAGIVLGAHLLVGPDSGVALASPQSSKGRLSTVAVLELAAAPEHSDLAAWLAESLSTELENSGKVRVLGRTQVANLLQRQAAVGGGDVSEEQAARLGKRAGASSLVTGRLSREGSGFKVELSMIDASSAALLSSASARFNSRDAVPLAARELSAQLLGSEQPLAIDAERLGQAAQELARRISHRFPRARTRITSLGPTGWALLAGGISRGLVPGLRMDVLGKDFVTGERELRGYLLVRQSDQSSASGPSKAITEPLRVGDEVVARELVVRVSGDMPEVLEAMEEALRGISHFEVGEGSQLNLDIQLEINGSATGGRRLGARILDRDGNELDRVEGMMRL